MPIQSDDEAPRRQFCVCMWCRPAARGGRRGDAEGVLRDQAVDHSEHGRQVAAEDLARQSAVGNPYAILRQLMLNELLEMARLLVGLDELDVVV